ncbi:voltage-dependent anion channel [Coniella lustricola]|uniref:Voltage-dependent anion channel n=1 Tax=Coniella lustricola TaxID=2025994 RepID=A0A2T3A3I6_9PEZI|nr:voltage-dependent anion channel [Coniella lustricola]
MTVDDVLSNAGALGDKRRVSVKDRIACFQWTWYTSTMATGGIANVLAATPFQAQWLYVVGTIFFLFNILLFIINTILLVMRFRLRPGSWRQSFTDQFESLFISASDGRVGTIFINICQYGIPYTGPWLLRAMEVLFWIWITVAIFASSAVYLVLWSTQVFPIHTMTPVWVFPAYPLLITAPFAGNLINSAAKINGVHLIHGLPVALAAVTVQGMGFSLSFMVLAAFVYRLMTQKLPRDTQRPGVFISVGPSGFTTAGIVQLGGLASSILPSEFMEPGMVTHAVFILKLVSAMIGLWLWGLAIWFFIVSVGSFWKYAEPDHKSKTSFQMTFFSFVFPNTALVTATYQIGKAFRCRAIEIVGCVMAGLLVIAWIVIFSHMLRSIWRRQLLWPKDD